MMVIGLDILHRNTMNVIIIVYFSTGTWPVFFLCFRREVAQGSDTNRLTTSEVNMGASMAMGVALFMDGVYEGKSEIKMDDVWGYPPIDWKPPY